MSEKELVRQKHKEKERMKKEQSREKKTYWKAGRKKGQWKTLKLDSFINTLKNKQNTQFTF